VAIKGKKRSRGRSGRAPAAAPRPFLVRPKTPLFQRRSTHIVLLLLLFGVISALAVGIRISNAAERRQNTVTAFDNEVQAIFAQTGVAQQVPPGPPTVLPEMGQVVAQLETGEGIEAREIRRSARGWERQASDAATAVERIDVQPPPAGLLHAKNLMVQGLRLYAAAARDIGVAVNLEGKPRDALVGSITQRLQTTTAVFLSGWEFFNEERRRAGIEPEPAPQDPGQFPPGFPGGEVPPGFPEEVPEDFLEDLPEDLPTEAPSG
jgi:hypothetical protein